MKITVTDFQANCLKMLDHVHLTGKPLEISKRGKVIAIIAPPPKAKPWKSLRRKGHMSGNAFEPTIKESEIEVLKL